MVTPKQWKIAAALVVGLVVLRGFLDLGIPFMLMHLYYISPKSYLLSMGAAADGKVKSSNLAFPLSADASAQLDAFAAGTVAMVALSIEGETIALRRAEADLPLASLAAALPTDEPSYCVFRWAHERDGAAVAPVLFVYMCPEDAPVRGKMLHASSKASI